ncbi:sigma-70 family RNA polymerase sigma factor [Aquibacillus koreensis]|uniref:Sigma-70 family RNA polymerase sigma factor n=1 Tax=Aquibacillus koreensis TaxID=279446 RepID=A0A9X4AKU1_9BACI|nr:sigma-70 family RNA polymerase sigma factor [Aquibacillus koreensis]MCT2534473.1 sigma-70 family RNA polymerase sigma factor [Aquibacillus koreensis]MDC3421780.1 sigma-70 family RNA polymerase sigma factor [Aquibacillus koreensis]
MDENLIQDAKQGCPQAIEQVVLKYSPIVERYAFSIKFPHDDIPDLIQEVFIKVYRFIDQVEVPTFHFWLYKITLNTARDLARKHACWQSKFSLLKAEKLYDGFTCNVEENLVKKMEYEHVISKMQELDDKYQVPMMLHFQQFLSYKEISDVMGMNTSTIKVRILRGKRKVAQKVNL